MKGTSPQSYVILGLLMEGPKHGYDLHRSDLLQIWSIPMSQLYALLKRLEGRGMITSSRAAQENRPDRRIFHLTEKGKEAFRDWIQRPSEKIRNIRMEFLAKLYIIHQLGLGIGNRLIEDQLKVCQDRREAFVKNPPLRGSFGELVLEYRLAMIGATIQWLKRCRKFMVKR